MNTIVTYEKANAANDKGATLLGLHLEGPYFSMNQRGAQDPRFIRNPKPEEYIPILEAGNCIRRWSSAPELDGDEAFVKALLNKNVLPAIAHSDAIYEEVLDAWKRGYRHITHLYSGMSGVTRRNGFRFAGVIESAFLIDDMTVEIIADGCHLPASLLQLIYKFKGSDKIALITDSMLVIHILLNTWYKITEDGMLIAHCSIFPEKKIAISEITAIGSTVMPISSYALSLDRLIIYKGDKYWLLISPVDKMNFINQLKMINPAIKFKDSDI